MLRNRLEILERDFKDVHADVLFLWDYGGRSIFTGSLADHIFIIRDQGEVRQFILEGNYDYIISIDTPEIYEMTKGMHLRMVLEVHTHYDDNRRYLKSILSYEQPTVAITVPTNYFKNLVEKETNGKIPVYTFYNFIGPSFKSEYENREITITSSCPKAIGWVGRLDSLKNWSEFLKIASAILASRKDVEFIIVGGNTADGPEKQEFIHNLEDSGLFPYVKWLPFYMHMPVFYKYLASTGGCFISTSKAESFGMTVLESMSCKCPVLCTNIGAYLEILNSGSYGLVYDLGNVDEAQRQAERILDSKEFREHIILNAYGHAINDYDPVTIMSKWIDFLTDNKSC